MKRHLLPCSLLCMLLAATTALGGPGDAFYEANLSLTRAARLRRKAITRQPWKAAKSRGAASVPEKFNSGMESGVGGREAGRRRAVAAACGAFGPKGRGEQEGGLFPETRRTEGLYPATRLQGP